MEENLATAHENHPHPQPRPSYLEVVGLKNATLTSAFTVCRFPKTLPVWAQELLAAGKLKPDELFDDPSDHMGGILVEYDDPDRSPSFLPMSLRAYMSSCRINGVHTYCVDFPGALRAMVNGAHAARKSWGGQKQLFLNNRAIIDDAPPPEVMCSGTDYVDEWLPGKGDLLATDWTILPGANSTGSIEKGEF